MWSVQAAEVNSQRGFVTVQSDPRLEVTVDALPAALQLAEWQSIPRVLEKDLRSVSASLDLPAAGTGVPTALEAATA